MEETYRTKAIILKRTALGENDTRVTLYTENRGRLDLVARGTKKISSKLAGHLEPLCLSDIMVVHGKRQDYIGAAVSENCFSNLKSDLHALAVAGEAVRVFIGLVREGEPDRGLFLLLKEFLSIADSGMRSGIPPGSLGRLFMFKLFCHLGHKPEFYNCVVCRRRITPGNNQLDLRQGGLICVVCRPEAGNRKEYLKVSDSCIKIFRLADKQNLFEISKVKIAGNLTEELNFTIDSMLRYNFEV